MHFFSKQIKISDDFGAEFIETIISCLTKEFDAKFIKENEVEMDLIFWDLKIGNSLVTLLSEGQEGTFLLGKKKLLELIIEKLRKENLI